MKQSLSLIRAGRRIAAPGFGPDIPAERSLTQVKTAEYRDFDGFALFCLSNESDDKRITNSKA
jgi:hypothetical protein